MIFLVHSIQRTIRNLHTIPGLLITIGMTLIIAILSSALNDSLHFSSIASFLFVIVLGSISGSIYSHFNQRPFTCLYSSLGGWLMVNIQFVGSHIFHGTFNSPLTYTYSLGLFIWSIPTLIIGILIDRCWILILKSLKLKNSLSQIEAPEKSNK